MIPRKTSRSVPDGGIFANCVEATALTLCAVAVLKPLFERATAWTVWAFVPYWLVMVVLSCRLGLVAGLCSAAVGVFGYLQTLLVLHQGVPAMMALSSPAIGFGILFTASAVVVGWLTRRTQSQLRSILTLSDRLRLEHEELASRFTFLMDEQQQLARRVIAQEETEPMVGRLFAPQRAAEVATSLMQGGKAAVYHFHDGGSRGMLVAADGAGWPKMLPATIPVVEQTLRDGQQTTIAQLRCSYRTGPGLASGVVLASPIAPEGGRGQLVLLMSGVHLVAFTPPRLEALATAMHLATRAIDRGLQVRLPGQSRPTWTMDAGLRVSHAN
jgi:hypothetical protein